MNVVVNYLGRKGGGALYAYEMTKGLIAAGCDVYAILPETIDNLDHWRKLGLKKLITVKTYHDKPSFLTGTVRFLLRDSRRLRRELAGIPVDICYVPMTQPWGPLVSRLFPKAKNFLTLHDPQAHMGTRRSMRFLNSWAIRQADSVIVLSQCFTDYVARQLHFDRDRIHVIPHGIFDFYAQNAAAPAIEAMAQTNFLFFGRLSPYKGLHLLAQAYDRLKREGHDISLRIVGSGDFSPYAALFPEENNICVDNRFVPDEEVYAYFGSPRSITVLPYTSATQSGVIPIAMQAGSLIVATNTGGLSEQTAQGKYAILCPPDADALYQAMKTAMTDYDAYAPMREAAKAHIAGLSWDKLSAQLCEHFKASLNP